MDDRSSIPGGGRDFSLFAASVQTGSCPMATGGSFLGGKAARNHNLLIANKPFVNVAEYKYLGTKATNQNYTNEAINSRLNSGDACYHSFIFCLPVSSERINIKIYKSIISHIVLYGFGTWSFPLREEDKLRVFENI
jgi:hypothetical protein